ncbi:MAG: transcription antitermination factor NusB [Candidatus Blackburnbacteria bacterium]|nr:transcription antitermination factor NusB [Candidatus Blackburnbacteria bacterium]
MKAANDPRHQRRRNAVRELFAVSFNKNQTVSDLAREITRQEDQLDGLISINAPEWPLDKLNRVDLAILQLAVYELTIEKKEPVKVVIDEAVELAKEMGSENSPGFVNGVLGSIVKGQSSEGSEKQNG